MDYRVKIFLAVFAVMIVFGFGLRVVIQNTQKSPSERTAAEVMVVCLGGVQYYKTYNILTPVFGQDSKVKLCETE